MIRGGRELFGEVTVSGAKNAAVAIIPAALLVDGVCRIENIPQISDVTLFFSILEELGAKVRVLNQHAIEIDCHAIHSTRPSYDLARRIRASYYLLGALLGRFGQATVAMPGGCNFGVRPIDQHIKGFTTMGAEVSVEGGFIHTAAKNGRLVGAPVYLDVVSVGATMNIMMAAALAEGTTTIENAACEPEIADLGAFLCACGADLRGAGTPTIEIEGGYPLHGATYTILPDRIETATYLCACAACGGALTLRRAAPASCAGVIEALGQCGCRIRCGHDTISIHRQGPLTACRPVTARPYPGFPTDAMPVLLAAQLGAQGKTSFTETIFENRFLYVQELQKLGAKLSQDGRTVRLQGAEPLHAARLHAGDLRGGAALVLGAMQAEGESTIFGVKHIQRGYDNLEAALQSAGARLKTVEIPIKV